MAGQVQLLASGPQDRFFTIDPDYSYFVKNFKKHSNFSIDFIDIDPSNEADFGKKVRFKIPQNQGDLLKTVSVKMTLPEIIETSGTLYIESVAHALIERVDLIVGDQVIQSITSDYLQIYSEHNYTQSKQYALEKLIGKYPLRTSNKRVGEVVENSGIIIHNTLGLNTDEEFFVDIPFYFYRHPELAIPLCAITKQEIEVEFTLRNAQDLVLGIDGTSRKLEETLKLKNFQLCTEVVFLDPIERIKVMNTRTDFIVTQIQQNTFRVDADVNESLLRLRFVHPVKELYFVIQREGATIFDYDNPDDFIGQSFSLYENLKQLTLTLDGEPTIDGDVGTVPFLKAVQGAIHHSKTQLIRRFYSYSFALQPEEWYPTGQINFSFVKDQILKLSLTTCPNKMREVRVYALSYNILRLQEGTVELLF